MEEAGFGPALCRPSDSRKGTAVVSSTVSDPVTDIERTGLSILPAITITTKVMERKLPDNEKKKISQSKSLLSPRHTKS